MNCFSPVEPINIFHGIYKTDNAPIRLSYHQNNHYNAVIDPYSATIGVGLGLAGHKPGVSVCACAFVCTCMGVCACLHMCVFVCMYVCVCVFVWVCVYMRLACVLFPSNLPAH